MSDSLLIGLANMTIPVFRAAMAADLPAIIALLADDELGQSREKAGEPLDQRYREAFRAIEADANQFLAVAVLGDTVIGTLQISFVPGLARLGSWRGQLEAVRIAAAHRNGGLGRQMVEWVIEQCSARGCAMVQFTTDKRRKDAQRFYERIGFVASHEGYKLPLGSRPNFTSSR
jgi:GNAT superfamily N-acetyltransferase